MSAPRLALGALCLLGSLFASSVHAQQRPIAALYREGAALRATHDDQAALAVFQEAERRTGEPRATAQVALAEGAMGRWADAESHLDRALAQTTSPWVEQHRAVLNAALETIRTHLSSLVVTGPAGASVWIAGAEVARLPMAAPLRLPAGVTSVELRQQGARTVVRTVDLPPGELSREQIDLSPLPPPTEPAAAPPTPVAPTLSAPAPSVVRVEPPAASHPPPVASREHNGALGTLAWVGLGAAALSLGGSLAFYLHGGALANAYNRDGQCLGEGAAGDPDACAELIRDAHTMGALTLAGALLGVGLGATSAALFATSARRTSARASLRCAPTLSMPGALCAVEF